MHPFSSIDTTIAGKKTAFYFIGQVWLPYNHIDSCPYDLSLAVHAFASRVLMSFSVDETLLSRLPNLSTYQMPTI